MKEIIIGANEADKRLDAFLKSYLKEASGGFIYKMLRKKNITLNGKKAEGTEKLKSGDSIRIFFADETLEKFRGKGANASSQAAGEDMKAYEVIGKLSVIYEDDNILLVNKPAGVLTQKADRKDLSLNEWLIGYLLNEGAVSRESLETYRPSVCNRLDRNTSGLVICAKSLTGARKMTDLIKARDVDKYYRTIVSGKLSEKVSLKGFLYKDESRNKVFIKDTDPKDERYSYIETEYEPVSYIKDKDLTILEVKLITGKPHQIRAHLSSIGHPIIGDVKYGGKKVLGLKYQLLHSYRLVFPKGLEPPFDMIAGKEFTADLPDIFNKIIK
ncbi:MAG: RluA family pseudouridine synthase [Butyrivibrio sp.]|nr:RluA family pseudouridine synthase [Butyrivibrio sp.]